LSIAIAYSIVKHLNFSIMANYNRAQRGSRSYWPNKESSSRGSNYGDRYTNGHHLENSDWNESRHGQGSSYDDKSSGYRGNENQYNSRRYDDRENDYRNQGQSGRSGYGNARSYDRDFDSRYYGNQNTYSGGSYEGGYGNRGYDTNSRSSQNREQWNDDLGYDSDYRGGYSQGRISDGGYGGSTYGSGNYGAYSSNYNRSGYGQDDERSWWDRSRDEVSSWFGDDDAERRREQDRQRSGQHKGKGPKGYRRSDERIKEDISDRLGDDPYIDASEIEISVSNGEVTLIGSVDNRSEKRRAEDIVENISGVLNVENRIRVRSSSGMSGADLSPKSGQSSKDNSSMSTPVGSATSTTNTSRKTSPAEA
jgi:osmotically-inducible protein OsmY